MDNMFQLKQDMTKEQLNLFAQDRLQKEQMTEEYLQQRETAVTMSYEQLSSRYAKPAPMMKKVADMPALPEDEKESKQKRRKKNLLKTQAKELDRKRRLGETPTENIFESEIRADMLTPKYVMENYITIRQKLDDWKKQLDGFDANPESVQALSREQQLRLVPMWQMYKNAELAFRSALGALGITYNEQASADKMFEVNLSEEEKANHLEFNRVIREKIEKTSIDEMVADKLIEESAMRIQPEIEGFREAIKADARFGFIDSEHMTHEYQYEEVAKLKELLVANPQEYARNKERIDILYQEFYRLMEVNGSLNEPSMAIADIQFDKRQVSSKKVGILLQKRLDAQANKMRMIRNRAECVKAGIKHLLLGNNLTETESLVVGEYVELFDAHTQARRTAVAPAADYADRYREKLAILESLAESKYGEQAKELISGSNNRFMMMMEPGQHAHNEEVLRTIVLVKQYKEKRAAEALEQQRLKNAGQIVQKKEPERSPETERAVKNLVVPYLERMRNFDTSLLQNGTDEELLEKLGELQELSLFGMQMVDLGKYLDPDDPNGGSIKDNFCGENKELFALKCSTVQAYAFKARAISMIKAYEQGALVPGCLTTDELQKLLGQYSLESEEQITPEQLLTFAKELLKKSAALQDASYNRYFSEENVAKKYAEMGLYSLKTEYAQKEFINGVEASEKLVKEKMGLKKSPNFEDLQEYYRRCEDQEQELKKQLETADEEEAMALQTELTALQAEMDSVEIWAALSKRSYQKVSDEKSGIKEPLFRSYKSMQSLPAFRQMSEVEFATMCKQLSAGALRRDADDPERKAAYLEENRKGLATYKVHMREHYEMLEERFHHKIPSIEYIEEHYDEIQQLFANVQVDSHLVELEPGFLDLTKEEDVRLYHLVMTYNAIAGVACTFSVPAAMSNADYKETYNGLHSVMRRAQDSIDFIEQGGAQPEAQVLEEKLAQTREAVQAELTAHNQKIETSKDPLRESRKAASALKDHYTELAGANVPEDFAQIEVILNRQASRPMNNERDCAESVSDLRSYQKTLKAYITAHPAGSRNKLERARTELAIQVHAKLEEQIPLYEGLKRTIQTRDNEEKSRQMRLESSQSPLVFERFHQLSQKIDNIEKADMGAKTEFIARVVELKHYLDQYPLTSSVYMTNYKIWYQEAKAKIASLAEGAFESIKATEHDTEALTSAEKLKTELTCGDPARAFHAIMQVSRHALLFQLLTFDKEELRAENANENWKKIEETEDEYAVDQFGNSTPEFKAEFFKELQKKKETLAALIQAQIEEKKNQFPAEMAQKDKELLAAFLVNQTELGREYDAFEYLRGKYRDEELFYLNKDYVDKNQEISIKIGKMEDLIAEAVVKYTPLFKELGYTQVIGGVYKKDFKNTFGE